MKNMKKMPRRKWVYPLLAFLLPVLVMLTAYITMGISPFGDQCEMIIDSYHQYVPFFSEFHYKIWHDESVLYSWHGSLGYNFWSVQAYYLASPLNFIIAIFPEAHMIEAFQTLIVLKIGLCGLAAYLYLRSRAGRDDASAIPFAGFYALGGFMIAYNWNVMWLDCVYMLPLIVRGAEKLIDRGDGRLYTVSLFLSIFCNYYISIMTLIFLVCWFFAYWFSRKRTEAPGLIRTGLHYLVCSLLALGMAALYLVPTYFTMINSSTGYKPSSWQFYRSFWDMFRQQFALLEPTQLTGAPNIYCGVVVFLLACIYAAARRIPKRERIAKLSLAAFLFVSLNVNVLCYIWHGFHFPNNLPGRFSFIYIFLMTSMAYEAYLSLRDTGLKAFAEISTGCGVVYVCCLLFAEEETPLESKIVTGILLGAYILLLALIRVKLPKPAAAGKTALPQAEEGAPGEIAPAAVAASVAGETAKKVTPAIVRRKAAVPALMLSLIMIAELFANTIYGLNCNGTVTESIYMQYASDMAQIRDKYQPSSDTFYRIESAQIQGRDDIIRYNMNGLSLFSSTCDDSMEELMGALGYYNAGNKYSYKGETPVTDAMLGIRYVVSNTDWESQNLELVGNTDKLLVYENKQALSVGYMVDPELADWTILEGQPFSIQNDFAKMSTGTDKNVFNLMDVPDPQITGGMITGTDEDTWDYSSDLSSGVLTFNLSFDQADDVYIYFEAENCDELDVIRDGVETTYTDERGHIVHLGKVEAGDQITLQFPMNDTSLSGKVVLQMASYDADAFASVYDSLSRTQLDVTGSDSTHISGSIDVPSDTAVNEDGDSLLMLSIPYDEGWTIRVDGEKVESFRLGSALTGLWLSPGQHSIEMSYTPRGFRAGIAISIISLAVCILLWRRKNHKKVKEK